MDANATILIVDSDAKSQKMLEVTFKKAGHSVILTDTLADARHLLEQARPAIVMVEVSLPDGSGFDLYDEIRALKDAPSVIFLGAKDSVEDKVRAVQMGADDFLMKPIFVTEMTSRVDALLQRRKRDTLEAQAEVTGDLSEVTIIDLLQTIEASEKSGSLKVERDAIRAHVFFIAGDIVDALCPPLKGEEALYRLMLWPRGDFTLRYHDLPKQMDLIAPESQELLLEGMKRFDRWNQMIPTLPHLGKTFEADYQHMATILQGSPAEVGSILRLFDGYRTMRQVIDNSPIDDITTLRVIRKLLDENLLRDVTPEEADLRETAQHTNLASWLSSTPIRSATKEEASKLFDTSPGVRSVPGLNGQTGEESEPSTDAEIEEVARSFEELAIPPREASQDDLLEEGQAPDLSAQKISQWRFHWDKESGQAVAAPTADVSKRSDPFALDDLDRDLAHIEAKRREEEARRLEADRQRLEEASSAIRATQPELPALPSEPDPKDEDEEYVKKDSTQELHRQSILEAVDDRERAPTPHAMPVQTTQDDDLRPGRDPKDGIEDMIAQAERQRAVDEAQDISLTVGQQVRRSAESLSDRVSSDFEAIDPAPGRTGTDEFDPIVRDFLPKKDAETKDEIDTFELPRASAEEDQSELVPLGSEISEEPVVSTQDIAAIEEVRETSKSAEREVVANRTAHNKELVQAEYDLQKGTPLSATEVAKINEPNEDAKAADAANAKAAREHLDTTADDSDEHEAPVLIAHPTTANDTGPQQPVKTLATKDEDEVYATEVPLFADEPKQGFTLAGLIGTAIVVLAVLFVFVFLNKDDPKPTTPEPTLALNTTQTPPEDATSLAALTPPVTPPSIQEDLFDASADALGIDMAAGGDAGSMALAALDEESAPLVAADKAAEVVRNASFALILALGRDIQGVEDPVAFLAQLPREEEPGEEPQQAAEGDLLAQAEKMLLREQLSQAKKQLTPLVNAQPGDGRIAGLYGRSLVYSDSAKAISEMNRAMGLGYKTPELYIDLGTAYYMRKDKTRAKDTYRTFLSLYPDHKRAKEVRSILKNQ